MQPKIILADEITGNLDRQAGWRVFELLQKVASDHETSILFVTHDLDLAKEFPRQLSLVDGVLSSWTEPTSFDKVYVFVMRALTAGFTSLILFAVLLGISTEVFAASPVISKIKIEGNRRIESAAIKKKLVAA